MYYLDILHVNASFRCDKQLIYHLKKIITIVNEIVSSLSLYVSPCPLYNAYQYILRVESANEKKSTFAFT